MSSYDRQIEKLQAEAMAQLERERDFKAADKQRANADLLLTDRRLIGFQLADARNRRRLSQTMLAERAAMNQERVSKIEGGKANPSLNTLLRLADALGARLVIEYQQRTTPTRKTRK